MVILELLVLSVSFAAHVADFEMAYCHIYWERFEKKKKIYSRFIHKYIMLQI